MTTAYIFNTLLISISHFGQLFHQIRQEPSYYATKHNERTQEFIDRLLAKTGHEELQSTPDKGKSVFIDRLKTAD